MGPWDDVLRVLDSKKLGEADVSPHAAFLPCFLTGGNIWRFCCDSVHNTELPFLNMFVLHIEGTMTHHFYAYQMPELIRALLESWVSRYKMRFKKSKANEVQMLCQNSSFVCTASTGSAIGEEFLSGERRGRGAEGLSNRQDRAPADLEAIAYLASERRSSG